MSIVATQHTFHPMRGHVAEGNKVACDNGETLTIARVMSGWTLTNSKGEVVTPHPAPDASTLTLFVIGYGQ